jgi:hypothetical protein
MKAVKVTLLGEGTTRDALSVRLRVRERRGEWRGEKKKRVGEGWGGGGGGRRGRRGIRGSWRLAAQSQICVEIVTEFRNVLE